MSDHDELPAPEQPRLIVNELTGEVIGYAAGYRSAVFFADLLDEARAGERAAIVAELRDLADEIGKAADDMGVERLTSPGLLFAADRIERGTFADVAAGDE